MKKALIIVLSVLVLGAGVFGVLSYNRNLKIELIDEKTMEVNCEKKWFTILDGKISDEFLDKNALNLIKPQIDVDKMDFDKFNYVVTINHKLKNIKYNYLKCNQRKGFFIPTSIIGAATLEKQSTNKIYIYKFDKINISSNWHSSEVEYE